MRTHPLLVASVSAFIAIGCGKSVQDAPPQAPSAAAPADAAPRHTARAADTAGDEGQPKASARAPAGFREHKISEGGFRVEAPGDGKLSDGKTQTPAGEIVYHTVMFTQADGALSATWSELPEVLKDSDQKRSMFDGGRDQMIKNMGGKLVSEEVIHLDGMEGRQWLIQADTGTKYGTITARVRAYIEGNRMYMLQGYHAASSDGAKAKYFLDSFRLLR